ncbi:type I restriction-modification system subunit M [Candidatus Avelusimicrobium stercoris]|uniref:type I restriction-modification system subunit M n=1 Tax=Candidatus Avelusimicrobium stercoris TaxID=1947924 RepID=UPI003D0C9734
MKPFDTLWDDNPVDITKEANFIWSVANKLRGTYMPDKYGDVIIPMTIIRRLECALAPTKDAVVKQYKKNPSFPAKAMYTISGMQFYNTSEFTLAELCNDSEHLAANFNAYINGFSANVQNILKELDMPTHIAKMDKGGCLFSVVKAFSELDLTPATYDSIKMGYIFENLIGRFYQNVDAGQYYTGRDIIKLCVSVLISEGCDDIFDDGKVITVCDQACGTGGMLSTAYSYIKHYNPTADVRLFGQELIGQSYAVGLAEMLIKGQNADNFRNKDTFKEDCFPNIKMRFVLENPPFGTPWAGADAKEGQESAVKAEYDKGKKGRWGAGLPGGGDAQLIFVQSAIDKLDPYTGRAAIIENGSPLFAGSTSSGESQIRRWLLENDLLEAIIALPTDLFYNTGIATYIWVLSKNKRQERKGKIQLIDATNIYHKLRKALGNKRNEISPEDRTQITKLYADFKENEHCKIYDNTEFIYKEYTVMQPLQRSYVITQERIDELLQAGTLNSLYDEVAVMELENIPNPTAKEAKKLAQYKENKPTFDGIINTLKANISNQVFTVPEPFIRHLTGLLQPVTTDKKLIEKVAKGLSVMDKTADVQKDKKGNIIYDKETKDTEIVKWSEDIDTYMAREVLPHIPDAKAFWEEDLNAKKPIIKTGAEIPFTRYFYKYESIRPSEEYLSEFLGLQEQVEKSLQELKK